MPTQPVETGDPGQNSRGPNCNSPVGRAHGLAMARSLARYCRSHGTSLFCIRDVGALRRQNGGEGQLIRRIIGLRAIFPDKGDGLCLAAMLAALAGWAP